MTCTEASDELTNWVMGDIFSTRLMFLYVQVCVRTMIVQSSDLKQSSKHPNCSEFRSEHVRTVSTWVIISCWDQASKIQTARMVGTLVICRLLVRTRLQIQAEIWSTPAWNWLADLIYQKPGTSPLLLVSLIILMSI